jgi:hypothetical protein
VNQSRATRSSRPSSRASVRLTRQATRHLRRFARTTSTDTVLCLLSATRTVVARSLSRPMTRRASDADGGTPAHQLAARFGRTPSEPSDPTDCRARAASVKSSQACNANPALGPDTRGVGQAARHTRLAPVRGDRSDADRHARAVPASRPVPRSLPAMAAPDGIRPRHGARPTPAFRDPARRTSARRVMARASPLPGRACNARRVEQIEAWAEGPPKDVARRIILRSLLHRHEGVRAALEGARLQCRCPTPWPPELPGPSSASTRPSTAPTQPK